MARSRRESVLFAGVVIDTVIVCDASLQRIKKALLLSYHVDCGKAKVTEVDRKEIRSKPHST